MSEWDATTWATIIAALAGVIAIAVALGAWLRPRSPKPATADPATPLPPELVVEMSNHFPVFDLPDGTRDIGDHLVGVSLRNGSPRPVKVTGWGLKLPGNRNLVVLSPTTSWEPPLPRWVDAGDAATWYIDPTELRARAAEDQLTFDDLRAYVSLADGRTIVSEGTVPIE